MLIYLRLVKVDSLLNLFSKLPSSNINIKHWMSNSFHGVNLDLTMLMSAQVNINLSIPPFSICTIKLGENKPGCGKIKNEIGQGHLKSRSRLGHVKLQRG